MTALLVSAGPAQASAPKITSFTPVSGHVGTSVTINGTGFASPATVKFGGVTATVVKVASRVKIVATVPPAAASGTITVTDAAGTATSKARFTVAPGVTLAPASGPPTTVTTMQFAGFAAHEAVDVYVDTTDVALVSASSTGTGSFSITIPADTPAGTHWITAVGRHSGYSAQASFLVRTNWVQYGSGPTHRDENPFENQLTTSTVSNLTQSWRTPARAAGSVSSPTVVDGFVYDGFQDGTVDRYVESTGALGWSAATGGPVLSTPAVANNIVYVGSDDGFLYAFNATTGAQLWKSATGNDIRSSPTVAGGLVYVGSFDDKLYAVNAKTGALVWSFATGNAIFSSPAVANGMVFIASNDDKIYALNAATGAEIWAFTTGANAVASPVAVGDRVYVGSDDDKMYCLRASNGSLVWSYTTSAPIEGTAAVANGIVYFGNDGGIEYAIRAGSGALVWSSTASSGALDTNTTYANGVVYVGDGQNTDALAGSFGGTLDVIPASGTYSNAVVVDGSVFVNDYFGGFLTRYTLDPGAAAQAPRRPSVHDLHPNRRLKARVVNEGQAASSGQRSSSHQHG